MMEKKPEEMKEGHKVNGEGDGLPGWKVEERKLQKLK
jgi:hypothetical protein